MADIFLNIIFVQNLMNLFSPSYSKTFVPETLPLLRRYCSLNVTGRYITVTRSLSRRSGLKTKTLNDRYRSDIKSS